MNFKWGKENYLFGQESWAVEVKVCRFCLWDNQENIDIGILPALQLKETFYLLPYLEDCTEQNLTSFCHYSLRYSFSVAIAIYIKTKM